MKRSIFLILIIFIAIFPFYAYASGGQPIIPGIDLSLSTSDEVEDVSLTVRLLFLLTIFSVAPAILLLMTSFTRIVIVFSFTRTALGTQQMPPTQVLVGLALFMTFFIMGPTFTEINEKALQPFLDGRIDQEAALDEGTKPLKRFMSKYTREKDLQLFLEVQNLPRPKSVEEIPMTALVPAYAISELKTAFQIGFMLFIPFLVIDIVISSTLMAMGMMMLPPVMISLPFKILLFVMVDGWYLLVKSLLQTY
jgi:flagellar biosynthetic protein FliP